MPAKKARKPDAGKPVAKRTTKPARDDREQLENPPPDRQRAPQGPWLGEMPEQQPDAIDEKPYPLFPKIKAGDIDSIRVFRVKGRTDGIGGLLWEPIIMPWQATLTDWPLITQICGGGSYRVQAIFNGKQIATIAGAFEGAIRQPKAADVLIVDPSTAAGDDGTAIHETRSGWLGLSGPGITPGIQASFLLAQQTAFHAREDAAAARKSEGTAFAQVMALMASMAEKFTQPDPSVAVLLAQHEATALRVEALQVDLRKERDENARLRIEAAGSDDVEKKAKHALLERGLTIADSVGGSLVERMMGIAGKGTDPPTPGAPAGGQDAAALAKGLAERKAARLKAGGGTT